MTSFAQPRFERQPALIGTNRICNFETVLSNIHSAWAKTTLTYLQGNQGLGGGVEIAPVQKSDVTFVVDASSLQHKMSTSSTPGPDEIRNAVLARIFTL